MRNYSFLTFLKKGKSIGQRTAYQSGGIVDVLWMTTRKTGKKAVKKYGS